MQPTLRTIFQFLFTLKILPMSSIIWYRPRATISVAGEVTAGLAKSSGSLPCYRRVCDSLTSGSTAERLDPLRTLHSTTIVALPLPLPFSRIR